jgi:hypothetical protein
MTEEGGLIAEEQVAIEVAGPVGHGQRDVALHSLVPFVIGGLLGGYWQAYHFDSMTYGLPTPPQFALLCWIVLSTISFPVLWKEQPGRWPEYLAGTCSLALPLLLVWVTGYGSLLCGAYLAGIGWIVVSASWPRLTYPPFRYGIWHVLSVNIGAFFCSILVYQTF